MPNNFRTSLHSPDPPERADHRCASRSHGLLCGNFRQLFPARMEFKYSLEEIGVTTAVCAAHEHWDAVLPGKVLRVQHEDVVEDLAAVCAGCWIPAVAF